MKRLFTIIILMLALTSTAQHSVTLTNGRVINGTIILVTKSEIIIQEDTVKKYTYPLAQVSYYYDGTHLRKPNGEISKAYNERYATAGDEFKRGSTLFYVGAGITCAGLATAFIVPRFYEYDKDDTQEVIKWKGNLIKTLNLTGVAAACVGILIQVAGVKHFAIAGNKINVATGKYGVGLSLNL